jgi:hypothetical protein
MELNRSLLKDATEHGLISEVQAQQLWQFLSERGKDTPSFRITHVLYYLGGLIAVIAMSVFMTLGWEHSKGWGVFFIALAYAGAGLWLTEYLLNRRQLPIPAGITATFVVLLTPLAVYGLINELNLWGDGREFRFYYYDPASRLFMELATLASGSVMLWRYRLPFLMMPIAVTLWFLGITLTQLIFRDINGDADVILLWVEVVSLWPGLLIVVLGLWVDIRTRHDKDYAFWLYLVGVTAFWSDLSWMYSQHDPDKFIYLCINLLLIVVGTMLLRKIFTVLGALGTTWYLGYYAYDVFSGSMMFPFILTIIGLGVIYLGIIWQQHEQKFSRRLRKMLPVSVRELVEKRQ